MATCGLKQEAVLLLIVHTSITWLCNVRQIFLHFLQSENIGSPDGDPISKILLITVAVHRVMLIFLPQNPFAAVNFIHFLFFIFLFSTFFFFLFVTIFWWFLYLFVRLFPWSALKIQRDPSTGPLSVIASLIMSRPPLPVNGFVHPVVRSL